ncbi:unnamed protein product, partial [Cladocopium goreaui]
MAWTCHKTCQTPRGLAIWPKMNKLTRVVRLQGDSPATALLPAKLRASQRRFTKLQELRDKKDEPDGNVGPKSFRILSVLGRGSFGEVFQVTQKTTGQIYAMKVLRKNKIIGRNLMRYALTKRNLLSYIRHPFIVAGRLAPWPCAIRDHCCFYARVGAMPPAPEGNSLAEDDFDMDEMQVADEGIAEQFLQETMEEQFVLLDEENETEDPQPEEKERAEHWRTEVPWMKKLLPCSGGQALPRGATYIALLRQPRKKTWVGYYKLHKGILTPPTGFKKQSAQCSFKEMSEHNAAKFALNWIWTKHLMLCPDQMPEHIQKFLGRCKCCDDGSDCAVLEALEQEWRSEQSGNAATDFGDGSATEASETATILPDDIATRSPQAGLSDGDTEPSETPTILPDDVATRDPQADPGASNAEPNMTGLGPQSQTAGPDAAVTVGPTGPAAATAASSKAPAEEAGLSAEEKLKKIKRAKNKREKKRKKAKRKAAAIAKAQDDSGKGLHAMLIVGYNNRQVDLGSSKVFIVRNSWGTSWGDKGYGYAPGNQKDKAARIPHPLWNMAEDLGETFHLSTERGMMDKTVKLAMQMLLGRSLVESWHRSTKTALDEVVFVKKTAGLTMAAEALTDL